MGPLWYKQNSTTTGSRGTRTGQIFGRFESDSRSCSVHARLLIVHGTLFACNTFVTILEIRLEKHPSVFRPLLQIKLLFSAGAIA